MITNLGKEIIAKYLLGFIPAYATHIAIGCGSRPKLPNVVISVTNKELLSNFAILTTSEAHHIKPGQYIIVSGVDAVFNGTYVVDSVPTSTTVKYAKTNVNISSTAVTGATIVIDYSNKKTMDFEMTRLPISSRGFVREDDTEYLVFGAEMPTENRYEITEVALWSAGSNTNAVGFDSRNILLFSEDENWQHHTSSEINIIPFIAETLGSPSQPYDILDQGTKVFAANANNEVMLSPLRREKYESPRFLNRSIFIRGDSSNIDSSFVISSSSPTPEHIHLDGYPVNLVKNSPLDKIKLAFSVVGAAETTSTNPNYVRIVVEFLESELINTAGKATMTHEIKQADFDGRYFVIEKNISDLTFSSNFSWSNVRLIRIHTSVIVGSTPSSNYYVVLDALRLDNINTQNPLHVMSGYSVVETSDERPIVKIENTSSIIEFRLPIGDTG